MVARTCNPSIQEAEAGGSEFKASMVHSEFKDLRYIDPVSKKILRTHNNLHTI
jgi:hypothetical protein